MGKNYNRQAIYSDLSVKPCLLFNAFKKALIDRDQNIFKRFSGKYTNPY